MIYLQSIVHTIADCSKSDKWTNTEVICKSIILSNRKGDINK